MHQNWVCRVIYSFVSNFFQAETLGCEGRVEEAQGVLKLCDQLKEERTSLQEAAMVGAYSNLDALLFEYSEH